MPICIIQIIFRDAKEKSEAYWAVSNIEQNKHTQQIGTITGELTQ